MDATWIKDGAIILAVLIGIGYLVYKVMKKEVSKFDWEYNGNEECLILDGEVTVVTDEGNFTIKPGDFVTFKDGLKCVWDVKKNIKKHYNFK